MIDFLTHVAPHVTAHGLDNVVMLTQGPSLPTVASQSSRRSFGKSSLSKLPDELLLRIVWSAVSDALSAAHIGSICSCLRKIVMNETRLWADIYINRPQRPLNQWDHLCFHRAGGSVVRATLHSVATYEALRESVTHVEELHLQMGHKLGTSERSFNLVRAMRLHPSQLRPLRFQGEHTGAQSDIVQAMEISRLLVCSVQGIFIQGQFAELTQLVICDGIIPEDVTGLPRLERIDFRCTAFTIKTLWKLLQASSKLQSLSVTQSTEKFLSIANFHADIENSIVLPDLMTLRITGPTVYAIAILNIIPNPRS
jgi:hypothetical protein